MKNLTQESYKKNPSESDDDEEDELSLSSVNSSDASESL